MASSSPSKIFPLTAPYPGTATPATSAAASLSSPRVSSSQNYLGPAKRKSSGNNPVASRGSLLATIGASSSGGSEDSKDVEDVAAPIEETTKHSGIGDIGKAAEQHDLPNAVQTGHKGERSILLREELSDDDSSDIEWEVVQARKAGHIDFSSTFLYHIAGAKARDVYRRFVLRNHKVYVPLVVFGSIFAQIIFIAVVIPHKNVQGLGVPMSRLAVACKLPVWFHWLFNMNPGILWEHIISYDYWLAITTQTLLWVFLGLILDDARSWPSIVGWLSCYIISSMDASHYQLRSGGSLGVIFAAMCCYAVIALELSFIGVAQGKIFSWRISDRYSISAHDIVINCCITFVFFCLQYCVKTIFFVKQLRRHRDRLRRQISSKIQNHQPKWQMKKMFGSFATGASGKRRSGASMSSEQGMVDSIGYAATPRGQSIQEQRSQGSSYESGASAPVQTNVTTETVTPPPAVQSSPRRNKLMLCANLRWDLKLQRKKRSHAEEGVSNTADDCPEENARSKQVSVPEDATSITKRAENVDEEKEKGQRPIAGTNTMPVLPVTSLPLPVGTSIHPDTLVRRESIEIQLAPKIEVASGLVTAAVPTVSPVDRRATLPANNSPGSAAPNLPVPLALSVRSLSSMNNLTNNRVAPDVPLANPPSPSRMLPAKTQFLTPSHNQSTTSSATALNHSPAAPPLLPRSSISSQAKTASSASTASTAFPLLKSELPPEPPSSSSNLKQLSSLVIGLFPGCQSIQEQDTLFSQRDGNGRNSSVTSIPLGRMVKTTIETKDEDKTSSTEKSRHRGAITRLGASSRNSSFLSVGEPKSLQPRAGVRSKKRKGMRQIRIAVGVGIHALAIWSVLLITLSLDFSLILSEHSRASTISRGSFPFNLSFAYLWLKSQVSGTEDLEKHAKFISAFAAGASFLFSVLFAVWNVIHYNRKLFRQLCVSFEVLFLTLQSGLWCLSLCDAFEYDWRCLCALSWVILFQVCLGFDAMTPTSARKAGSRKKLIGVLLALLLLFQVWLNHGLFFDERLNLKSRVLFGFSDPTSDGSSSSSSSSTSSSSSSAMLASAVLADSPDKLPSTLSPVLLNTSVSLTSHESFFLSPASSSSALLEITRKDTQKHLMPGKERRLYSSQGERDGQRQNDEEYIQGEVAKQEGEKERTQDDSTWSLPTRKVSTSFQITTLNVILSRQLFIFLAVFPVLWALLTDGPCDLHFIYGTVAYEIPNSSRRRPPRPPAGSR